MRITKTTTIGQLLEQYPDMGNVLTEIGMHCIGCPSARNETLEQAAEVHDMDADELIEDIKGFLGA
jgi:hybrid cluster-associated redox disulfide protein